VAESKTIALPDVGDFKDIEIIEILIAVGDQVEPEQSIIVLESDKATMEIPSPFSGTIEAINVKVGDRVNEGDVIASISSSGVAEKPAESAAPTAAPEPPAPAPAAVAPPVTETPAAAPAAVVESAQTPGKTLKPHPGAAAGSAGSSGKTIHASPSIRRYARELGVNLEQIIGSGPKGRIAKADVKAFVKASMAAGGGGGGGITISSAPEIDYSKFGEIETVALSRIKKISGAHLHRSWVTVPHVTQFDEADITELEAFRKSLAKEAEKKSVRLTPLVFLMKAVVSALQEYPNFNASLDASGENLIMKKYFHIGIAVDTPNGLVVPVVRDVDQKGLFELAAELGEISLRARDGKLSPGEMQGGCFTISSLGGIGGTYFTPIVNAPEVAILGVSRSKMQPVYIDGEFEPRLMLPLGLSYDHRVIDGAQAARFTNFLSQVISDIRRILL
jgi:pyruvate dehydrogenase E2 component (dihydrolipoamide acetyltransferase)